MRLIDADEYIEKLRDRIGIEPTWNHSGLRIAIFELHNMPTIDPVKHGRWIHDGKRFESGVDWMHCSECGNTDVFGAKSMYHYCPNCGARMEGVEE